MLFKENYFLAKTLMCPRPIFLRSFFLMSKGAHLFYRQLDRWQNSLSFLAI